MRQLHAVLSGSDQHGWTVAVPEMGHATIDEPGLADHEARLLIERQLGVSWSEAQELDVTLVDDEGEPVYVFELLFTSYPTDDPAATDPAYARLAADPPPGCRYEEFGPHPGLRCIRRGTSRFQAIAALIAEIRQRYGLAADDLGFEKLWEWFGSRDRRERMIAHLLLMAVHRARWTGVPIGELVGFLRTVAGEPPAEQS